MNKPNSLGKLQGNKIVYNLDRIRFSLYKVFWLLNACVGKNEFLFLCKDQFDGLNLLAGNHWT